MKLRGVYVPVVTPFDDNNQVDYEAYRRVLEHVIANGVAGIIPCGTTGEYYSLNEEERLRIFEFAQEVVAGRVTMIAGTNAAATRDVVHYTQIAKDLGYEGVMLAAPYYSLPSQGELLHHFQTVATSVDLPIVLYNFPARVGVEIGFEVLDGLIPFENVIGIKESSGSIARLYQMKMRYGDRYQMVCGADDQALDFFVWGAESWIAGGGSFMPHEHVDLMEAAMSGNYDTARELMWQMMPVFQNMESAKYTQKAKYACELVGMPVGQVREPLMPLDVDEKKAFRQIFDTMREQRRRGGTKVTVSSNGSHASANGKLSYPTQAFINGQFVDAQSGRTFATENPATGKVITRIAECNAADVDTAVQAARAAYESGVWSKAAPADRKKVLLKLADLMEAHAEELAMLDAIEAGKPITDCRNIDVPDTITTFRWYAEAIDKVYDQISPTAPDKLGLILKEPIGVVGAVIPWNFPLMMAAWKVAPALASGNSMVLKPAELTSLSALKLAELVAEAGVPEGVFNVVTGYGETSGQAIGRHMDIDMVSFTGSTEVGRMFLRYASETNLKRIVLECGGKSPQIVMGDVTDLDTVAEQVLLAALWNMGENCSCGSRLVVQRNVKDALLEKLVGLSGNWRVGDPLDPATNVGAMIERAHLQKVMGYIAEGTASGAHLVIGGRQVLEETGGYYVEPTIFDNVDSSMAIAQDEIFGPVLSTLTFDTEEEGIAIANNTNYGLASSLWTNDINVAHRVARAIKAGTVSVNCYSEGDITAPFGGYKLSGFGGRDKSLFAFDQYTQIKTIWIQNH